MQLWELTHKNTSFHVKAASEKCRRVHMDYWISLSCCLKKSNFHLINKIRYNIAAISTLGDSTDYLLLCGSCIDERCAKLQSDSDDAWFAEHGKVTSRHIHLG